MPVPKCLLDLATPLSRRVVLGFLVVGAVLPMLGQAAGAPEPTAASSPGDDEPSPDAILAHPAAVNPFAYAELVKGLWEQGRRQQATFWFYVFQIRTRPWAMADKKGDEAAALRSSLNDTMGGLINGWVASDLAAWQTIAGRAVSYERRLPLAPERPRGLGKAAWLALVASTRAEYAQQMHSAFAGLTPESVAARRREAGLPVGPLDDPGPPLPDDWR